MIHWFVMRPGHERCAVTVRGQLALPELATVQMFYSIVRIHVSSDTFIFLFSLYIPECRRIKAVTVTITAGMITVTTIAMMED